MAAGADTPMTGTAVARLAEFATTIAAAPPPAVLHDSTLRLLDVVGISVAALDTGPADVARSLVARWGGAPVAGAIGVAIRNALAFKLYGGPTGMPPTHQLKIRFSTTRSTLILDPATALPSNESYGIDASYQLIEVATGKTVLSSNTFARTSYDIPGQLQRFARARAFRDAEDRAAQEIADNINTRLAAFFYAGT